MKHIKTLGSIALAALLFSSFSGCSSDDVTGDTSVTGYYLDSAVGGVDYTTSNGDTGETGADGSFQCQSDETVTIKIGDLVLRTLSGVKDGQKIIENDDAVITLLQSIDEDGDATNGITVTPAAKKAVKAWLGTKKSIDVNTTTKLLNDMTTLRIQLQNEGETSSRDVNLTEAQEHVATTVQEQLASSPDSKLGTQIIVGDMIKYVDYKGEIRTSPKSAAAAEYHTGTGYGNTLFDSAENKCQNCHNELYDTWEGSMHGKSWTDPIFQSKFQDFLRTHIAKIGEDKSAKGGVLYQQKSLGVGTTKNMFTGGAALTCIKCHAPGAYYAGDFKVTIAEVTAPSDMDSATFAALKTTNETNLASTTSTYDATKEAAVIASNANTGKVYRATYQIGHKANREGINCAFCHSIETPRMMKENDTYTLKKDIRVGPHGPVKAAAASSLTYDADATDNDMNKFFRLWGPEKPADYASMTKSTTDTSARAADGRYTMASVEINGTNGKTHYTGGPFYGPFGLSGKSNENSDDNTTDRKTLANPHFDKDSNNHFGESGKSLCLSCHQRSAGAAVPAGHEGAGQFMELCTTQMAVTTGDDTPTNDTLSSPKCQKCHMERIEGNLLHQWARPDLSFDATEFETAVGYVLTPELDEKDTTVAAGDNPQRDGWFNSHAFLGASKTGHKTSATAKIKSGFSADMTETSNDGDTLVLETTFTNKTAHMFPGAHPMRRALTRLIVTDGDGNMLTPTSVTGLSTFGNITNSVQPMAGKTLAANTASTTTDEVDVYDNGSANLSFPGKVADLNGSAQVSQRFYSDSGVGKVTVSAPDGTVKLQSVTAGKTTGKVFNAAIVDSNNSAKYTRIYGHETGKMIDIDSDPSTPAVFVVRPGFDSNVVASDTRLSPNETETYTATYNITGLSGVSATYKVYYMQKGANGQFIEAADSFLDLAASNAAKHIVTEVFTKTLQ